MRQKATTDYPERTRGFALTAPPPPLPAVTAPGASHALVGPGVGAFAACMAGLRAVGGDKLIARRIELGRPVLGICVGMQVLFTGGVEHGGASAGCAGWPGTVG